jgi:adenine phosphoribosyltransferase
MTFDRNVVLESMPVVPDFPKPGIQFFDVTGVLLNPTVFQMVLTEMSRVVKSLPRVTHLAGMESRGFLFAAPLAAQLNLPFVLIRKKGKLPRLCLNAKGQIEYGDVHLEMHRDDIPAHSSVVVLDDLLATGGTLRCAEELVRQTNSSCTHLVLLELKELNGVKNLQCPTHTLISV